MKKFVKVMLIIAAVFMALGIGFSISGAAMGSSSENAEVFRTVREQVKKAGNSEAWSRFVYILDEDWEEESQEAGEPRIFRMENIDEVEVELKYEDLIFEEYDGKELLVEVENDPAGSVRVKQERHELKITSNRKKHDRRVKISYPAGTEFRKLEIGVDAGIVEIKGDLKAYEVDVEIGAGEVSNSGTITARECEIQAGAGRMELGGLLAEKLSGECGMGEMKLSLQGKELDYDYKLECGVGNISIAGEDYSGLGKEKKIQNAGAGRTLELECGMGSVTVEFEE